MRINGEEVEQVAAFSALRSGDVVYDRLCNACGRHWCRAMLTVQAEIERDDEVDEIVWKYEPDCAPRPDDPDHLRGIGPRAVARGDIYRVINPPLPTGRLLGRVIIKHGELTPIGPFTVTFTEET